MAMAVIWKRDCEPAYSGVGYVCHFSCSYFIRNFTECSNISVYLVGAGENTVVNAAQKGMNSNVC